MLAPIVVLPTVAGLANALGPLLIGFVFAGPSGTFVEVVAATAVVAVAWLLVATAVGAWLDVGLAGEAVTAIDARALGDRGDAPLRSIATARAVAVRLLAHVPTAIVVAWAAVTIVEATYQELIAPGSPTLPVPIRVALRAPDAVALVLVAWLLGEAIGGLALRRLAGGMSVSGALVEAVRAFVRPASLATFVVTGFTVAVAIAAVVVVPGIVFDRVRLALAAGPLELLGSLVLLVATWVGGLLVLALALAWRQVAWTLEGVFRGVTIEPREG